MKEEEERLELFTPFGKYKMAVFILLNSKK